MFSESRRYGPSDKHYSEPPHPSLDCGGSVIILNTKQMS
jgi:hypothetical protein